MSEIPFEVPGGWAERDVEVADRVFKLLLPADPDQVLESQIEAEQDGGTPGGVTDPYWAALWSSAVPTAESVLRADWRPGQTALEIGCGMGVVGLAALASGMNATFSDYIDQALQLALENATRNGFPHARGITVDWNSPEASCRGEQFSVILASDILYNRANHVPIVNTIDRLLAPGGVCWIGDPGRFNSREFLQVACDRFQVKLRDLAGGEFAVPVSGQFQMFVLRRRQ